MILGMSSYSWLLVPESGTDGAREDVATGMVKLGLWGMTKQREGHGEKPGEGEEGQRG
jgi:hypothetical protein